MVLAGLEEHSVARVDHLDRSAAALHEADAFGDVDGLAVGVSMPRGSRPRGEVDASLSRAILVIGNLHVDEGLILLGDLQ